MTQKYYRYVPHSKAKKYEDLGWVFDTDLGPPHAAYASLYKWEGAGDPIEPENDIRIYPVKGERDNEQ